MPGPETSALVPVQPELFDTPPAGFDGATIDDRIDTPRLTAHLAACHLFMSDSQEHTLREVANAIGCSEAAASARIRDLRKAKFGGHTVERRRVEKGLWVYRLARRCPLITGHPSDPVEAKR